MSGCVPNEFSMATQISEDFTCCVCLKVLEDPVSLPHCSHNVCFVCAREFVEHYANKQIAVTCPLCCAPVDVGLADLQHNKLLEKAIAQLKSSASSPAISRNVETPIQQISSVYPVCDMHNEPCNLFCVKDLKLVCALCVLPGSQHEKHSITPAKESGKYTVSHYFCSQFYREIRTAALSTIEEIRQKKARLLETMASMNSHKDKVSLVRFYLE